MKLKYIMAAFSLAAAFCSCQESAENHPVAYMTDAQKVVYKSVTIDATPAGTALTVSSSVNVGKDTNFKLAMHPELLEEFNATYGKNYALPPADSYTMDGDQVTIAEGFNQSSKVNFTVTSLADFKEGTTYCMPVMIESADNNELAILEPSRTLFIVLKTPVFSKAIYIGSNNKYKVAKFLDAPELKDLKELTLECRVYVTNFSNGADNSSVMGIEGECAVRFGDVKITNNTVQIVHDSYQPAAVSKPFDTGKWYHIAAVKTTGSWDIYIDGQFAAGTAMPNETIDLSSTDGYGFGIGALSQWQSSRPLMGYMAEVRVWTRALSQMEIANNMNYIDPQTKGLAAYWRMNQWEANTGGGNIVRDLTGHGYDAVGQSSSPTMIDTKWM